MTYIEQIVDWLSTHKSSTLPAWLKRNPLILDQILINTNHYQVKNVMERVYILIHSRVQPYCKFGNPKKFNTFDLGYRKGCIKGNKCPCVSKYRVESQKQTLLSKYGTTSVSTIPGIVEKRRNTSLKRYGVAHPAQTESNRVAAKLRVLNRSAEKVIEIKEKSKITNLRKYGASHHMETKTQQQKVENSNISKYGVKFPLQNVDIKNKFKQTIALRSDEQKNLIQQLKQQTLFTNYNVDYPSQINLSTEAIDILTDKDKFIKFITGKTRNQVVDELGIHHHTLYLRANQYQATELFAKPIKSQFEQEIFEFVSKFSKAESSNRSILNGKELDMYIPEKKLAIECCGLYWHSETAAGRGRTYHSDKFKECHKFGIKLITIFQDEWQFQKSIVQHRLKYLLNSISNKFYARNCEVKLLSSTDTRLFLENYHLQKHVEFKISLGLIFDSQLLSVMTFGKPRFNKTAQYEILRFASSCNVIGAASKLFSNFIKLHNPNSVISYSDNRWGDGSLYQHLKFIKQNETIGYFYTDYKNRFNRVQFQKHKLVKEGADPSLTEWQIMQNNGYDRIWDCGQTKWLWTASNK